VEEGRTVGGGRRGEGGKEGRREGEGGQEGKREEREREGGKEGKRKKGKEEEEGPYFTSKINPPRFGSGPLVFPNILKNIKCIIRSLHNHVSLKVQKYKFVTCLGRG
jgi:hypothetical protein